MSTSINNDRPDMQPPMVGNPMLAQVRDFIDQDDAPPSVDPIGIIVRAVRGRVYPVASVMVVVALLSATAAYLAIKPAYQSSGMLRILPTEGKILYSDRDDSRLRLYDAFFNSEMRLLTSRPTLESALQKLYQTDSPAYPLPEDVGGLAAMIAVSGSKGLISLASRSSEPDLSAAVVNAIIASYQENNEAARNRTYDVRREELRARESELESSLNELNEEYLQVGGEHDASTLAKAHVAKTAQLEVIEERIAELDNTIAQMQTTGAIGAEVGNRVEIQRATLLDQAMADMTFERAQRLAALETLKGRYQPTHPKLYSARVELEILESAIEERRNQIALLGQAGALTGAGSGSDAESLEDLQGVMARLRARRDTVRTEAEELNSKLIRIRGIATEKNRLEELLAETKRALDEVLVESQNDLSRSVEVIALGKVPKGPIEDKRKPAALGALVFGGLGAFTLFIGWNVLMARVRFSDDLDSRSSDVLAAVIMHDADPGHSFKHAAQKLRNELDLRWPRQGDATQVIGVVGAGKGTGTSRMAHSLGVHYSQAGLKVLIVDTETADDAAAIPHTAAEDENAEAHYKHSASRLEQAQQISEDNERLLLLPSVIYCTQGPGQTDRNELTLDELGELLSDARPAYDLIILDLGSLTAGRQSAVGAALADRSVLIAACGTVRKDIGKAQDLLDRLAPGRYLLTLNLADPLDPAINESRTQHSPEPPYNLRLLNNES